MVHTIQSHRHGFVFDGQPRFILAGTLNYFRLHPDDWRPRLEALKACGFNTVDTYVPWNYHEQREGLFDFSSFNRNLDHYLSLCHEVGLWVYLRPGPYICNEWDGGGLPTWLTIKPEVDIRQNDPAFLQYAFRYLSQIHQIARKHLYTQGGPIILFALENELDFYHCRDPHAYISALRDHAIAGGIDVPLTCCIGLKTHIKAATGLVDGVIPSPNIYANGPVDRVAAFTYLRVIAGTWASGKHMDDIPVIVTEMHCAEGALRRILSGGFKGLAPFNFSGGTHFGRWNSTTNWGGQVLIPTSVDFGSQITFDGQLSQHYYGSRLVAGLIHAFEDHLLACDPITTEDRGPGSPNPNLGWKDKPDGHGLINSLMKDESGFVFLYNGTAEPQDLKFRFHNKVYPRFVTSQVAPGYTHIALLALPMQHMGIDATIRYSSAEVAAFTRQSDGPELVLYGPSGQSGEICFDAVDSIRLASGDAQLHPEGDTSLTLCFTFGSPQTLKLTIGNKPLTITLLNRQDAETHRLNLPRWHRSPGQELLGAARADGVLSHFGYTHTWTGEPKALEHLDILQGAGCYEAKFTLDEPSTGPLTFAYAADFVSATLDEIQLGTQLGNGNAMSFDLPVPLAAGEHTLRVRAEIWGHANFNEGGWPSGKLGSLRGITGEMTLAGIPVSAHWRAAAENLVPCSDIPMSPEQAMTRWKAHTHPKLTKRSAETLEMIIPLPDLPQGGTLVLQGQDIIGDIFIGDDLLGRFAFGPTLPVRLLAGPPNEFYLPRAMVPPGSQLQLHLRQVTLNGQLTSVMVHPLQIAISESNA